MLAAAAYARKWGARLTAENPGSYVAQRCQSGELQMTAVTGITETTVQTLLAPTWTELLQELMVVALECQGAIREPSWGVVALEL